MPRETTRLVSKRELEKQKIGMAQQIENNQNMAQCVPEPKELCTLTLEADNIFIEFEHIESYRATTIQHELLQFCQSLRIIENTITVTKEESTGDKI